VNFVEICNVCTRKVIIKAGKTIFNSDKICRSYCDFYFGVTFLEHTVVALLFTVRLVGGRSSKNGRLEVFHNGAWGRVCGNGFTNDAATVVCLSLELRYVYGIHISHCIFITLSQVFYVR